MPNNYETLPYPVKLSHTYCLFLLILSAETNHQDVLIKVISNTKFDLINPQLTREVIIQIYDSELYTIGKILKNKITLVFIRKTS